MKIRRGIIGLLTVVLIAVTVYGVLGIKKQPQVMDPLNLTVYTAPEQSAAMENPNFIKEEYVPVLPEGTNIALDGKVQASSFADVYTPRKTIDGNVNGVSYWEGKPDSYPDTLTVDLRASASISGIRVCLCPLNIWGKRTQTFALNVSKDGVNYEEVAAMKQYTFDPDTGNEVILQFDPIETQYVQLSFTENSGASGAQVAEFEIYSK